MEKRKAGGMDDYDMKKLARDFKQSFGALSALMTAKEGEVQSKGTDSAGKSVPQLSKASKRPRPVSLTSVPPKRPKGRRNADIAKEPTTPDQPTKPYDPKLTGDSSRTVESQSEESTKKLLVTFLGETIDALDREFGYLYWQTSGHKVHLFQMYITPVSIS